MLFAAAAVVVDVATKSPQAVCECQDRPITLHCPLLIHQVIVLAHLLDEIVATMGSERS